jgi:hypothetical protein
MTDERAIVEQQLIAAEHARRDAITRGDLEAIEGGLADHFYYAHIGGLTEGREAFLERTAANLIRFTAASDLAVEPRNGYALLTGKSHIETEDQTLNTLFLSVWERADDGWKIAAYASTPLPTS